MCWLVTVLLVLIGAGAGFMIGVVYGQENFINEQRK